MILPDMKAMDVLLARRRITPEDVQQFEHDILPIIKHLAMLEMFRPRQFVKVDGIFKPVHSELPPDLEAQRVQLQNLIESMKLERFGPTP